MKLRTIVTLMLALMLACSLIPAAHAEGGYTLDVWYALGGTSGEAFLTIVEDFNALNTGIVINASYSGGYTDSIYRCYAHG